jgi:S-ribosylhomocysteine lyase
MSVIGTPSEETVADAWEASMHDILAVEKQSDIPELNVYQCGTYTMHSLEDAKAIATEVLRRDIDIMDNEALALDLSKVEQ